MPTSAVAAPSVGTPRPELHLAGVIAVGGLVLLGIGAIAGGVALVAQPDGSAMQFSTTLLAGSPFSDFFVPGLILGGLFGVGSLVVAAMGMRRSRLAPFLAFTIGCAQIDLDRRRAGHHRRVQLPAPGLLRHRARHRGGVRSLGLADLPGVASGSLIRVGRGVIP